MSDQAPQSDAGPGPRVEAAQVIVRFVPDFTELDQQIEERVRSAAARLQESRDEPAPAATPIRTAKPEALFEDAPARREPTERNQEETNIQRETQRSLDTSEKTLYAALAMLTQIRDLVKDLPAAVDNLTQAIKDMENS